jgi:hypothetical protein
MEQRVGEDSEVKRAGASGFELIGWHYTFRQNATLFAILLVNAY